MFFIDTNGCVIFIGGMILGIFMLSCFCGVGILAA